MTPSGKLVDANGKAISNQVIHLKAQATAAGTTFDRPMNDTKTDGSGTLANSGYVTFSGIPSFVT
jgi:hypothetical protein